MLSRDLLKNGFKEASLFSLLVDGESMQPVINDKALIVADLSQKELIDEAIYVLYHGSKMWVKKYDIKSKSFVSINPKYSHLVYAQDDVHLVGRVLLTFTNL
ncbi:MAG: S24 family peptidase [Sulfurimonas sp.]|nr:S24 family peptidase [Sulfurimonas sp.]